MSTKGPYLVQDNAGRQKEQASQNPYDCVNDTVRIHTVHTCILYICRQRRIDCIQRAPGKTVCSHCNIVSVIESFKERKKTCSLRGK